MDEKQAVLRGNIDEMNKKIEKEREKTDVLRVRKEVMGIVGDVKGVDAERVVDGLREQVKAVYRKCGFDADTQTDTLDVSPIPAYHIPPSAASCYRETKCVDLPIARFSTMCVCVCCRCCVTLRVGWSICWTR